METNTSKTVQSTNCKGTNVYVNCCCPGDGGEAGAFKGTNVYVDARNDNANPDGTINNPYKRVQDAFDYVDSNDESYIVNIIHIDAEPGDNLNYTFNSKGNIGIVGSWVHVGMFDVGPWSLRVANNESKLFISGLKISVLDIYGTGGVWLNDVDSNSIRLYNINYFIDVNNCRGGSGFTSFEINSETESLTTSILNVKNSSLRLIINNRIYYANLYNSYIESIATYLSDENILGPIVQMHADGCIVGSVDNVGALKGAAFSFNKSLVYEISQRPEGGFGSISLLGSDFHLGYAYSPKNYSPDSPKLLSNLEAIDKKLGELEARLGA